MVANSSVNAPMARRLLQMSQPSGAGQLNTQGQIYYDVIFGDDALLQQQEEARLRAICMATSFEDLRVKYSQPQELPRFWTATIWSLLTVLLPSSLLYAACAFASLQVATPKKSHVAFD